jgi:hypothetical protein
MQGCGPPVRLVGTNNYIPMYLLGIILAGAIADVKRKGCHVEQVRKREAAKCVWQSDELQRRKHGRGADKSENRRDDDKKVLMNTGSRTFARKPPIARSV